jgi:ankyrin repeat protein
VGSTPLHSAAAQGRTQAVQLLLAHCGAGAGEELARVNEFGLTAWHALALGRAGASAWETALALSTAGADTHARTRPPQADLECLAGDTALHLAAQHSQPGACMAALVYYLLMAGLDPLENAGHLHTSPLEYACAAGGECRAGREEGRGASCTDVLICSNRRTFSRDSAPAHQLPIPPPICHPACPLACPLHAGWLGAVQMWRW